MILPMRDPTAAAAAAAAATATVMASTSSSSGASSSSSSSHSSSASHLNNIRPPTIHPQLAEMLSKEHELFMKRAHFFKNHFRYPMQQSNATGDVVLNTPTPPQQQQQQQAQTHKTSISHNSMSDMDMVTIKRHKFDITDSFKMSGGHCNSDEIEVTAVKHGIPSPMIKAIPESMLLEPIEEETKCVVCNANFPSVWLLEQHAALQHSTGSSDEKPFICEQCGQSYRYRSAYVKHKEQNHRARLPADKLFTCDVCGMQFRYLKSFKKHRLNHALERLHGKRDKKNSMESSSADGIVTSTNESHVDDEGNSMHLKHEEDGDEEQDNTVDSATHEHPSINVVEEIQAKISSSAENEVSTPPPQQQHPHQHQPSAILPLRTSQLMSPTMHLAGNSMVKVSLPECSISGMKSNSDWWEQQSARFLAASHGGDPNEQMPTTSVNSLINAEHIPSDRALGLNPQEASILNFLRVDAAERQRDRRFACPFCGKCVRSKENLKLHVRKHTGERPFVCLFCGRAFGGKSDLTRHLRIHTGERPYHCESCGKCFARADYLSKHLTTHVHNTANAAPR